LGYSPEVHQLDEIRPVYVKFDVHAPCPQVALTVLEIETLVERAKNLSYD
jgi:hypothetical protein